MGTMDLVDRIQRRFRQEEAEDQAKAQRVANKIADKLLKKLASGHVRTELNEMKEYTSVLVSVYTRMTPHTMARVEPMIMPALLEKVPQSGGVGFSHIHMKDTTWDLATCPQFFGCLLCLWPIFFFRLLRVETKLSARVF